jgi:putative ATP-binding cassette transporter
MTEPNRAGGDRSWVFRKFWSVARAYWVSDQRWTAFALLAAILGFVVVKVYSVVMLNDAGGRFFNALQSRSQDDYVAAMWLIAGFLLLQLVCIVCQAALTQWLEVRWRRWLTDHLVARWLDLRAYYRLRFTTGDRGATGDTPSATFVC